MDYREARKGVPGFFWRMRKFLLASSDSFLLNTSRLGGSGIRNTGSEAFDDRGPTSVFESSRRGVLSTSPQVNIGVAPPVCGMGLGVAATME
jgi:hypothetical protein